MIDRKNISAPPTPEILEKFVAIVGEKNAISKPDDQAPYLTEWRDRYQGKSPLVLLPKTTDEVSRILRLATETKTAIIPQGGNTGLVGGQIPNPLGHEIIVNLSRMNRIRSIDPKEFTITVDAGITLAEIQKAANNVNRLFPLSLASEGTCQIGGNLATNAGGVGVLAYGSTRGLTLGLEAVMPDGSIWNGLRKLKKDNTGYDLKDLLIGSEGTLGIITGAVLQLVPKPEHKLTTMVALPNLGAALEFFQTAREKIGPALTAFELISRLGITFVTRHMTGARDPFAKPHPWYVLIECSASGNPDTIKESVETLLERALEQNIIEDAVLAQSETQSQALWDLREQMSAAQKPEGGSIKHDISVPIKDIPQFIKQANELVEKTVPGARPVPFGHFGDGNIHYNISQPAAMEKDEFLKKWEEVSEAVHALVMEFNGSISAEHGIGQMKRDLMAKTKNPVELAIMRAIKNALDPLGIMNPGKLL